MLTVIIPWLVRHLHPLYQREQLAEDNLIPDSDGDSSPSDSLDVHITIGSWIVESLAYIAVATTTTLTSQLAGLS